MSDVLHFEGGSDDTFGEYNTLSDDYDNCASGKPIRWLVTAPDGESLIVFGQFCPNPAMGWMIGVARADEDDDTALPKWPMRFERGEREYSPRLVIEAPDGVKIRCLEIKSWLGDQVMTPPLYARIPQAIASEVAE
jgi:hypothetical protein